MVWPRQFGPVSYVLIAQQGADVNFGERWPGMAGIWIYYTKLIWTACAEIIGSTTTNRKRCYLGECDCDMSIEPELYGSKLSDSEVSDDHPSKTRSAGWVMVSSLTYLSTGV